MGGSDTLFLACVGLLVIAAEWVQAASGWACPVLIRKSQVEDPA